MYTLIYLNEMDSIAAKKFVNKMDYNSFKSKLLTNKILVDCNVEYSENITEENKELFTIFYKSMKKQWNNTASIQLNTNLEPLLVERDSTPEPPQPIPTPPVPTPTPVKQKKPRKKKNA